MEQKQIASLEAQLDAVSSPQTRHPRHICDATVFADSVHDGRKQSADASEDDRSTSRSTSSADTVDQSFQDSESDCHQKVLIPRIPLRNPETKKLRKVAIRHFLQNPETKQFRKVAIRSPGQKPPCHQEDAHTHA